jgi:hypothetical protein
MPTDCDYDGCDQEAKVRLEEGTRMCRHHAIIALVIEIDDAAEVQMAIRNARPLWSTRIVDDGAEIPRCNECGMQMARVAGPGPKSEWTCVRCDPGPDDPKAPGPFDTTIDDGWAPGDADDDPPQDWYFTFGSGHYRNEEPLARRFVRINGTASSARQEMIRHFGFAWSHQYRTPEGAGVELFGLTEFPLPKEPSDG